MHKKHILALLLVLVLSFSGISVFAAAESIIIDGEVAQIPTEMGMIREMDERTFVPIRFVMEYLDCHVDYDEANHAATISADTCAYLVQEDNPLLFIIPYPNAEGGQIAEPTALTMDTTPFIVLEESRMYIPIRFLAQAIGYEVGWDDKTQIVTLTSK